MASTVYMEKMPMLLPLPRPPGIYVSLLDLLIHFEIIDYLRLCRGSVVDRRFDGGVVSVSQERQAV